jgi:hypothetical protein
VISEWLGSLRSPSLYAVQDSPASHPVSQALHQGALSAAGPSASQTLAAYALSAAHWSLTLLTSHIPSLPPGASLACFSVLCDFTLEVSLAYLLCWLLVRFATYPGIRFSLWTGFLLASAVAWLATLGDLVHIALHAAVFSAAYRTHPIVPFWGRHWAHTWSVPQSLAERIGLCLIVLVVLYAAGLARLGIAAFYVRHRLRAALVFRSPAPAAVQAIFATVCADMRVSRCNLWLLPGLPSPATLGSRRPCVYLPPECLGEDPAMLADVLRHELAHVSRRDSLWECVARVCRALVFFHPALYRAFSDTRLERELASDRIVVRTHPDTRDLYADTLVRFGWRTARRPDRMGIGFAARTSLLHARVQSILAGEPIYSLTSRRLRGLLSAGAFGLFTVTAPAFWVGFHLAALPPSSLTVDQPETAASAPSHLEAPRRLLAAMAPVRSIQVENVQQPKAVVESVQPSGLPDLTPAGLPNVRYQNSESALLSQTSEPSVPSSGQPTGTRIPSNAPGVGAPSGAIVTATVDAAIAIARIGGGGYHNHEHDEE